MLEVAGLLFGSTLLLTAIFVKPIEAGLRAARSRRRAVRRRRRNALQAESFEAARRARETAR